jgi:hypothetical protein
MLVSGQGISRALRKQRLYQGTASAVPSVEQKMIGALAPEANRVDIHPRISFLGH